MHHCPDCEASCACSPGERDELRCDHCFVDDDDYDDDEDEEGGGDLYDEDDEDDDGA